MQCRERVEDDMATVLCCYCNTYIKLLPLAFWVLTDKNKKKSPARGDLVRDRGYEDQRNLVDEA